MADGLRFTDLTQLASNNVNGQDITAVSHYNAGSYSSVALQIQDLGRAILGNLSYTTELPNFGNQTIYGALLQLLANFANIYNPANTYALNDCVIYQGVLYKCTTAISTPEAWDNTHWTAIKAVDVGQGGGGGGASSLGQLSDVTITSATLSDGQVLKYDSSSQLWINVTPDLSLMSDVTISSVSLSNGQFLVYDSTSSKWVNKEVIHEPLTQAQYDAMVQAGTVDPTVYYPITDASIEAGDIDYDNTSSGLTATDVQGAIDEILATVEEDNLFKGTIASGSSIRSILLDTNVAKGVYFYQAQNATDNPESGTLALALVYKHNAGGTYSRVYLFVGNNIYYASTSSSVPSTLTWSVVSSSKTDITSLVTFNETITGTSTEFFIKDNVLYIFYQGESKAHSASDLLFTLPSGYRPSMIKYTPFLASNGVNFIVGDIYVNIDGTCKVNQISDTSGAGRIYFSCVIPL